MRTTGDGVIGRRAAAEARRGATIHASPAIVLCLLLTLGACKSKPSTDAGTKADAAPTGGAAERLLAAAAAESDRAPAAPAGDLPVPEALVGAQVALEPWTGEALRRAHADLDAVLGMIQTPEYLVPAKASDPPVALNDETPTAAVKAYVRGLAAHQQGERFTAINELEQARRLDPNSPAVLRLLGQVYVAYRNEVKGAQRLVEAVRAEPDDAESLFLLGRIAFERQRWDEAIAVLARSKDADRQPTDPAVPYQRGYYLSQALLRQGFDAAGIRQASVFLAMPEWPMRTSRHVREVGVLDRQRGRVNEQLGDAELRLGHPGDAIKHYDSAVGDELVDADLLTARRVYANLLLGRPRSAELALIQRLAQGQATAPLLSLVPYVAAHSGRPEAFTGLVRSVYVQTDRPGALALAVAGMLDDGDASAFLTDHLAARPQDLAAFNYMARRLGATRGEALVGATVTLIGARPEAARSFSDALVALDVPGERWIELIDALPSPQRDSASAWFLRGAVYEHRERVELAADCYDRAVAADAGFIVPHRATIDLQIRLGRYEKALQLIDRVNGPKDDELRFARAQCLIGLRRYDEALAALDQLIASQDRNASYRLAKARVQIERGQLTGAEATLWTVLNLSPTHEDAYAELFALYRHEDWADGGPAKWVNLLREVQQQIPSSRIARLKLAEYHIGRQEYPLAERPLLDLLATDPEDQEAELLLVSAYYNGDRAADAERYLMERLRKPSRSMQPLELLRGLLALQNRTEEYYPIAERYLRARTPNAETYVGLAVLYVQWEKPAESSAALDKAIEARGGATSRSWRTMAMLLNMNGQTDRGVALLAEATEQFPGEAAELMTAQAMMLDAADRKADAERLLLRALEIDADHAGANNNLAYLYAESSRELDRALAMAERAVKAEPKQGAYLDTLAWVRYKRGEFAEAVRQLDIARQLPDGADPVILDHLGDALWRTNQQPRAIQVWQEALRRAAEIDDKERPDIVEVRAMLTKKLRSAIANEPPPVAPIPGEAPVPAPAHATPPAKP